ncbi:hypothetical protein BDK51DRAFT_7136, partial [Blyttiomyces helicus]
LPYTNKTLTFTGTIDHILYTSRSLAVRDVLGKVNGEYLDRVPSLPAELFPSDHLSLLAWFRFR